MTTPLQKKLFDDLDMGVPNACQNFIREVMWRKRFMAPPTFEPEDYPPGARVCVIVTVWPTSYWYQGVVEYNSRRTAMILGDNGHFGWGFAFNYCYRPRRHD